MDNGFRHLDEMRRPAKPPKDPEPPEDPRKKKRMAEAIRWDVQLPNGEVLSVKALTRSEARAKAKAELKIPAKGRLPLGTIIKAIEKPAKPKSKRKQASKV